MMASYATRADLYLFGIKAAALVGITTGDQDLILEGASRACDSYLEPRYSLPLTVWGTDLKRATSAIAAWDLLAAARGYNPESENDPIRKRYDDAIKWLVQVRDGSLGLVGAVDATPSVMEHDLAAYSDEPAGW
jgi:phage gp36-like protein